MCSFDTHTTELMFGHHPTEVIEIHLMIMIHTGDHLCDYHEGIKE